MAARKKATKKSSGKKTKPARRAAGKKAATKLKSAKKKAPSKTAAKKVTAPATKVAPAKPTPSPVSMSAPKPVPKGVAPRPTPPPVATGSIAADEVNLGHLMALRPRIHVGFRPSAFGEAKLALADARYATIQDAARAVAEKAIEISNESGGQDPFVRR
jgi:hypothetical protein